MCNFLLILQQKAMNQKIFISNVQIYKLKVKELYTLTIWTYIRLKSIQSVTSAARARI